MAVPTSQGVVKVGLLGDIQYADRDDRNGRYYRGSLDIVNQAVDAFNAERVDAVVTLGDMIDGYCADGGSWVHGGSWARQSEQCLDRVKAALAPLTMPRHGVVGNHELYNFNYIELDKAGLSLGEGGATYYVRNYGKWDLIFLNTFEHAIHEVHFESDVLRKSVDFLKQYRPDIKSAGLDQYWMTKEDGTKLPVAEWSEEQRAALHKTLDQWFVPFDDPPPDVPLHLGTQNGGSSEEQRAWLKKKLGETKDSGRNAIVFSHAPVFDVGNDVDRSLAWDHKEICEILHEFKDTVYAMISGHAHQGGYRVDQEGIHHVVMNAPLQAEPGPDGSAPRCWGVLELSDDAVKLRCCGRAMMDFTDGELDLSKGPWEWEP